MIILEDEGQKEEKHLQKNNYWKDYGIEVKRVPLPVGDYIIASEKALDVIERKSKRGTKVKKMDFLGTYDVCVDTKKDMQEIVGNICGKQHERFRDECILAQNNGIKLYILVENEDGIASLNDVQKWINPRLEHYKKVEYMHNTGRWKSVHLPKAEPTSGSVLSKAMSTMQDKYGVEFVFCTPDESGKRILSFLNEKKEE